MSRNGDIPAAVLIDAAPVIRAGLCAVLTAAGCRIVGETGTGGEALALLQRVPPDVVVADLRLPDVSPADFCQDLRLACPESGIVVFGTDHFLLALEAGVEAVVSKRSERGVVVAAVAAAAAGSHFVDPALATVAWLASPPASRKAISPLGLTLQELRVLSLLPDGVTNEDIAERLAISRDTVKTHIANIQRKLHARSRTDAAVAALRLGLG
jgi:DNA-binding NarL/FixJ family response regulator